MEKLVWVKYETTGELEDYWEIYNGNRMNKSYTIRGRQLRFGDPEQIAVIRDRQEIFSGSRGFEPEEICFWDYSDGKDGRYTENIYRADQIRAWFHCKRLTCGKKLCFHKPYQPPPLHYQSLLRPWPDITCGLCGTEYRMDADEDKIWVVINEVEL